MAGRAIRAGRRVPATPRCADEVAMNCHVGPVALLGLVLAPLAAFAQPPRTVGERTDYQATATNAEVIDYCRDLARQSPRVRVAELGTTHEGRKVPLVIVADP